MCLPLSALLSDEAVFGRRGARLGRNACETGDDDDAVRAGVHPGQTHATLRPDGRELARVAISHQEISRGVDEDEGAVRFAHRAGGDRRFDGRWQLLPATAL